MDHRKILKVIYVVVQLTLIGITQRLTFHPKRPCFPGPCKWGALCLSRCPWAKYFNHRYKVGDKWNDGSAEENLGQRKGKQFSLFNIVQGLQTLVGKCYHVKFSILILGSKV